jgi:hypothetical protein
MTDDALRRRLREAREVRIVTTSENGRRHRTIVWVVVDGAGRILVRSYRGPGARWYREAISGRPAGLEVAGDEQPVAVARAPDEDRVTTCSCEIVAKYVDEPETPEMLREEVLETTLELVPLPG